MTRQPSGRGAQALSVSRLVDAPPAQVYYAFTNSSCLLEWLSDSSQIAPQLGGRLYLAWNSGYYTSGEPTHLESPGRVAFTWLGRGEPAETQVQVTLAPQGSGTLVTIEHSGFGTGAAWEKATDVTARPSGRHRPDRRRPERAVLSPMLDPTLPSPQWIGAPRRS